MSPMGSGDASRRWTATRTTSRAKPGGWRWSVLEAESAPEPHHHPRRRSRTRSPASRLTGGSTNAVLHLLAIAREAGVELDIDDFDRISERTPLLADLKPGGRFVATDLYRAGGVGR